jgi:hypothetical protein
LILLVRGVWQGTVPLSMSGEGLTWPEEVVEETNAAIDRLQGQIDLLDADVQRLGGRAPG